MNAGLAWLTERPIAHRGLHDNNLFCWENTLSAFARAVDRGYAIECDVHLAADRVPVVFHDDALMRLTRQDGFIWQRTSAELGASRVGGTADTVPTLAQVLNLIEGRVPLIVEIKGIPGHDEGLVAEVGRLLGDYRGKVAVMSFDHWIIRRFTQDAPGVPAGLTAWGADEALIEAHFSMLAHGIDFVSYDVAALPNRFTSFVRNRLQMPVISWTVRDEPARELTRLHADQMTFESFEPELTALA